MRAIILAAGQGSRLRPLTDELPKCLVEVAGAPILEHQIATLRACGIEDLHIVTGFQHERINYPQLTRHLNADFATTNMVASLFCAAELFDGSTDIVITYGDIVYEPRVLQALLACDGPLCLAIDRQWRRYWQARMEDPLADAETLRLDDNGRIREVGKRPSSYDDIEGQYIGLIKVSASHARQFVEMWQSMDQRAIYDGQTFATMYMTSFLQHLIDAGWAAHAVPIDNGWLEIDAPSDLAVAADGFWSANSTHVDTPRA